MEVGVEEKNQRFIKSQKLGRKNTIDMIGVLWHIICYKHGGI